MRQQPFYKDTNIKKATRADWIIIRDRNAKAKIDKAATRAAAIASKPKITAEQRRSRTAHKERTRYRTDPQHMRPRQDEGRRTLLDATSPRLRLTSNRSSRRG